MKAEIIFTSSGKPAVLLTCEGAAEIFALTTIVKNGVSLFNYGGNSREGNMTALIGAASNTVYRVEEAPSPAVKNA